MAPRQVPDGRVPPVRGGGQVWWRTPLISRPSECWRELNGASCQLLVSDDDELGEDERGGGWGGPARAGGLEVEVLFGTEGWFGGLIYDSRAARQHSKCDSPMQTSDAGSVLPVHFSFYWNKTRKYRRGHGPMTWSHACGCTMWRAPPAASLHLNSLTGYSGGGVIRKHLAHWEISHFTVFLKPEIWRFAWERMAVTLQLQSS